MKKKNLFITLGLALGLGIGAAVGVGAKQEAKAAKAYTIGETFYFEANQVWSDATNNTSTFLWAHFYKDGGSGTYDVKLSHSSGKLYYGTWPDTSSLDRIMFARGNSSAIQWDWGNETWGYSFDFILSGNNYIKQVNNGWGDSQKELEGYMEYRPEKTAGQAFLRGSWSGGWGTFDHEMTLQSANVYKIENVLLTSGSQIKATTIGNDKFVKWYDASDLKGNSDATFVSPNITINTTGNYTVTVNTSTKVYTVDVYEDVDLTAAETFADDFKSSMASFCPVVGSDPLKGISKLTTEWSGFASRFADTTSTSTAAQDYLKTLDDGGKIEEFRERYDSILTDYYSYLSSYDFLNRAQTLGLGAIRTLSNATNNTSMTVISIAAIASVGLLAVGGYFLIKKKHEN